MSVYNIAGVYRIQNDLDGKTYIGQSIDIMGRWRDHIRNAWQSHPTSSIAYAMKKEGPENFSFKILARMDGTLSKAYLRRLLKEEEIKQIELHNSYKKGYNSTPGGNLGGFIPEKIKNKLF